MPFTDEDLKRLKAYVEAGNEYSFDVLALLARLEAAEALMPDIEKFKIWALTHPHKCTFSQTKQLLELLESWQKAAGKS